MIIFRFDPKQTQIQPMVKKYFTMAWLCYAFFATVLHAQVPVDLGTDVNGTFQIHSLTDFGVFRQVRLQAPASPSYTYGTPEWNFRGSNGFAGDLWRPYTAGTTMPGLNQIIRTSSAGSARYNSAGGGGRGLFGGSSPGVVANAYYTFNIMEANDPGSTLGKAMSVLQTTYNPVAINTVSQTSASISASNSQTITVTTATSPSNGEFVYIRYSTNINFTSSSLIQVNMLGTTGVVGMPCFPSGTTVYYYVYSSNQSESSINSAVSANGQFAHDLFTLRINNNSGTNYSYSVAGSASSFSGIYNIPSLCYPSVASFVLALNAGTVAGPITVNVARGHREQGPSLGINLTATGTATNRIVFRAATGSGAKPIIFGSVGFAALTSNAPVLDYIWNIDGGDFITIDGIDLQDTNSAGAQQMEHGYQITRRNLTDGSQNIKISNCKITFRNSQVSIGVAATFDNGNKGIAFIPAANFALNSALTIANSSGRCINDTISNDTVINANIGIYARSFSDAVSPFSFLDQNFVIENNYVFQFGEAGIKTFNINNVTVRNNRLDNNNQKGITAFSQTVHGIWMGGNSINNASLFCIGNTITLRNTLSTNTTYFAIRSFNENQGTGKHHFINNTMTNCYNSINATIYGIGSQANLDELIVSGNRFVKSRFLSAGTVYPIHVTNTTQFIAKRIKVRNNILEEDTFNASTFSGIHCAMSSSTIGLYGNGIEISGNRFGSLDPNKGIVHFTQNTSTLFAINTNIGQGLIFADSNIVSNWRILGPHNVTAYGLYNLASPIVGISYYRGNVVRNIFREDANATNVFYGIRWFTAVGQSGILDNNTIRNVSGFTSIWGLQAQSGKHVRVRNNSIDSLATGRNLTTGVTTLIGIDQTSSDSSVIENNNIKRLWVNSDRLTQTNSTVIGLNNTSASLYAIMRNNRVTSIFSNATWGYARGIVIAGSPVRMVFNNLIGDVQGANLNATSTIPSAIGIEFQNFGSTTPVSRVFNNTVFLNQTNNANANFSTAGFYITSASALAEYSNNLIHNLSRPGSSGVCAALWSTVTNSSLQTAYNANSNNNIYFCGTPRTATNPLLRNSADNTADTTICQVNTRLASGRDLNSLSANVPFLSTDPNNINYLMVDASIANAAESNGRNLPLLDADIQGQTRNRPCDIGADEFTGIRQTFGNGTFTATVSHPSTVAVNANTRDVQMLLAAIAVTPSTSTPTVISRMVFNTSGSTNASTSIDTAKLWYTAGVSTFSNPVLLGTVLNPSGSMVFNLNMPVSCSQTGNFWITYGIRCPGSGFVVDCQLDSVYLNNIGSAVGSGAPSGTRTINNLTGMSGTYTVGGTTPNYATLALAITDINTRGLSGSVRLDVRPDLRERVPTGGLVLNIQTWACGAGRTTSLNTLTIASTSTTAKPILYAATGTATNGSATMDAIFRIIGEDYIFINGLDIRDTSLNTSSTMQAEAGIILLKRNQIDGCKRVVVENCNFRLNKANASTGSVRTGHGSVAFMVTNLLNTSNTSVVNLSSACSHDSITFKNNTIAQAYTPILFYGPDQTATQFIYRDKVDSVIGNNIWNFGQAGSECNAIQMLNVDNYVIAGNNINNMSNGGNTHVGTGAFYAIRTGGLTSNTTAIENNTGGKILNNIISMDFSPSSATTTAWGAIFVAAGGRNKDLEIRGNLIQNIRTSSNAQGAFTGIHIPNGAVFNKLQIVDNDINNVIVQRQFTGIQALASARYIEFTRDTVLNIFNYFTTSQQMIGILRSFTTTSSVPFYDSFINCNNNLISNFRHFPTSISNLASFGINLTVQGQVDILAQNNRILNFRGVELPQMFVFNNGNQVRILNNTVDSVASMPSIANVTSYGIFTSSIDSVFISNNTVTRNYNNHTTSGTYFGIISQSTNFAQINSNKVGDVSMGGTTNTFEGIRANNPGESNIFNNVVGDLRFPGAFTSAFNLYGLAVYSGQLATVRHNTIFLNNSLTGSGLSSAAFYIGSTNTRVLAQNNIFYNTSSPGALGITAAFSKIGAGLPSAFFLPGSDGNLLYAGTPSSTNAIYRNQTDFATDQFICDYQLRNNLVSAGREGASFTGTITFASTTASNAQFLRISTASSTIVESTGVNAGLLLDIDGDSRNLSTPDVGADEGGFTPASFTPSASADAIHPQLTVVPQGAKNVPMLRIEVITSGSLRGSALNRLRFATTGTNTPSVSIDSARVYFTGNLNQFSTTAPQFGQAIANPNGTMIFNGNANLYCNDTFYFWLVYDAKCGAGDSLDAVLDSLRIGSAAFAPTTSSPAGKIPIGGAALSGTYTVGGTSPNYTTIADAVTALNQRGIAGNVIFEVRANHTEIAPNNGIRLNINSACSGRRPNRLRTVTFRKSGTGANPKIFNYQGTNSYTTPNQDAMFAIIGEDYIIVDGIDLEDSSASSNPTVLMEWGYALLNANSNDGCKRIVIRNCDIKLSKAHRQTAAAHLGAGGSQGIILTNVAPGNNTQLQLTGRGGSHDSSMFMNNSISRVNTGITASGFFDILPFALFNQNDSFVNNSITNFGDSASPVINPFGIRVAETNGFYAVGNTIDNMSGGGRAANSQLLGIAVFANNVLGNMNVTINNNQIRVRTTNNSNITAGIYSAAGGFSNRVQINNNRIFNSGVNNVGLPTVYGVLVQNKPYSLSVSNDTIQNLTSNSTVIALVGTNGNITNVNNNLINNLFTSSTSTSAGIQFTGLCESLNIQNNKIVGGSYAGGFSGITAQNANTLNINNNEIRKQRIRDVAGGFTLNGIVCSYNNAINAIVRNNLIEEDTSNGSITGISMPGCINSGIASRNTINRIVHLAGTSTSNFVPISATLTNTNVFRIDSNTVTNDTSYNGFMNAGISLNGTLNYASVSHNRFENLRQFGTTLSSSNGISVSGSIVKADVVGNVFNADSTNHNFNVFSFSASNFLGEINLRNNTATNLRLGGAVNFFTQTNSTRLINIVRNNFSNNRMYNTSSSILTMTTSNNRVRNIIENTISNNQFNNTTTSSIYYLMNHSFSTQDSFIRVWGNTMINNSTNNSASTIYGYYTNSLGTLIQTEIISRNRIQDLLVNGSSTGSGQAIAIFTANGSTSTNSPTKFIDSNIIIDCRNITGNSTNTGIFVNFIGGRGGFIRNNYVDSISAGSTLVGIDVGSSCHNNITLANNKVGNVFGSVNASVPSIYGIRLSPSSSSGFLKHYIHNNTIGRLASPNTTPNLIRGLSIENGVSTDSIFITHNTIHLNATTTGTTNPVTALFISTTPRVSLRNNLVNNLSTQVGSGLIIAYQRSSNTLTTMAASSNNNAYNIGTSGTNKWLFFDGITGQASIAAYQTLVGTSRETQSISATPTFQSIEVRTDSFLKLTENSNSNCAFNRAGTPVSFVPRDQWNFLRNTTRPDIGAHEFNPVLPAILQQPKDSIYCLGQTAVFTVQTNINAFANFQWFKGATALTNGGNISGANTRNLNISNLVIGDTGNYFVKIWNCPGDTINSTVARLLMATSSTAPTAIAITPNKTICSGASVTLKPSGGSKGAFASYKWYTGSCGGTAAGTGDSLTVSPSSTTIYFVRAENICMNTACASDTVILRAVSTVAVSINSSADSTCGSTSITLSPNGGSLGTGGVWRWYGGSCGGTLLGSGTSFSVTPTTTTTYWLRAEGICNTTSCVSKTIKVNTLSTAASAINSTADSTCGSTAVTLTVQGGALGSNASWRWYSTSCGSTLLGSGNSIVVTPSASTTYFVRAEGTCNTTSCVSKTIKVNSLSVAASTVTSSLDSTCGSTAVNLGITGGSLGGNARWRWYSGSCGGTLVGSGSSLSVTPSVTTTYFLRAEGTCNTTSCVSKTIKVNNPGVAPSSVSSTLDSTCGSTSVTLTANGFTLGTFGSVKWYSASCGSSLLGTGTSITVTPTSTTTYFARVENACGNTVCVSKQIKVNTNSTSPTSITSSADTTNGVTAVTLNAVGGTLGSYARYRWYSGSCGGTLVGTGSSITITPTVNTTYFLRIEGLCNTTTCVQKTQYISTLSVRPTSILSSVDSICTSGSVTLTQQGGSLGTGARYYWYSGSCGGTYIDTGASITVSLSSTTTYFVRAQGPSNTTLCASKTIKVNVNSTAPTSITSTADSVCSGSGVTLTVNGGSLGSNARWTWYSSSCGGTLLGTGNSISVTPSSPTTYFVRAEGTCNSSACASKQIRMITLSTAASSILSTADSTCGSTSITLSVNGGSLGNSAVWRWYRTTCAGTLLGSGNSISVTPSANTEYFVRAEGLCNVTSCTQKNIKVLSQSVAPNSLLSNLDSTCGSQNVILKLQGGAKGSHSRVRWFTGSCGGTLVGTGDTLNVIPNTTTTYFGRIEGFCNTTSCVSKTIKVNSLSTSATSIIASIDSTCGSTSVTLSAVGGSLGSNARWRWYINSCGGTLVGTGNSISVTPAVTTLYYLRAEGTCNNSNCVTKSIKVNTASTAATSIASTVDSTCGGSSVTLSVVGGSRGSNAVWRWYSGSCGSTLVGTGNSISVTPSTTTTYFVRAEGTCNTTACVAKTIKVNTSSTAPTSITSTADTTCGNTNVTLTVNGGTLGSNARWRWYTGSCGVGTIIGSSNSITVNPSSSASYFVRAEGTCNTTSCASKNIIVRIISQPATSIAASADSTCGGTTVTLSVVGGRLGTGDVWRWYSTACGTNLLGTGSSISVTPSATTTYFVRAEGPCNNTICVSKQIKVNSASISPTSAVASRDSICPGNNVNLSVLGGSLGSNASWRWYSGSCGGTLVGTGQTISVAPGSNTTYFVRAEGTCNSTICVSKSIRIMTLSNSASSIVASLDSTCGTTAVTLSVNGGSLGSGAVWRWFRTACNGTTLGTGNSISVTPTANTLYFVRAEGLCNTTLCVSKNIKVNNNSIAPTGIVGVDSVCSGNPVTLTAVGGTVGSNALYRWYSGTCGGTLVGAGKTISVNPTANTTYFVRLEGTCNTTACVSKSIRVISSNTLPTTILATADSVCGQQNVTLTASGGNLGGGAAWRWYIGSCGGTLVGSGNSLTRTISNTTTFFLRAEGGCGTTTCITKTIKFNTFSTNPTVVLSTVDSICAGSSVTLSVGGGSLGSSSRWQWYSGICGGPTAGSGNSITVSPSVTTTYFVRGEGACNNTICINKRIIVNSSSAIPTTITYTADTICAGTSVTASVSGGTLGNGASWIWRTGSCTGPIVATGNNVSLSPSTSTEYFVSAVGACGSTGCISKRIVVFSGLAGVWNGRNSTNWNDPLNWCAGIPTASTNVMIPAGTKYAPSISGTADARDFTIESGAVVSLTGRLNLHGNFNNNGTFNAGNGTISVQGSSTQTLGKMSVGSLIMNNAAGAISNGNIIVANTLTLTSGSLNNRGVDTLFVTQSAANAIAAGAGNVNFRNSYIMGCLCRAFASNTSTYDFPVGDNRGGYNAELINLNLQGVSRICAKFGEKIGDDLSMNVADGPIRYRSVNNAGVWYLNPSAQPASGNFNLRLNFGNYSHFTSSLRDNSFNILRRDEFVFSSGDWILPVGSKPVFTSIASGYTQRDSLKSFSQFGIGESLTSGFGSKTVAFYGAKLYPNPASEKVYIAFSQSAGNRAQISVRDQAGKLVLLPISSGLQNGITEINTSSLSEGIYYAELMDVKSGATRTFKFTIFR